MDCGQGKVKEKGPNFWQGFILWLKYAKSSFSGAFRRQPERSAGSYGISLCAMGGQFEPGCSLAAVGGCLLWPGPGFFTLKKNGKKVLWFAAKDLSSPFSEEIPP